MTDKAELKRRAEELIELERVSPCGSKRVMLIDPETVLALIAENERLRESDQESIELCDTLSSLLGQVAVAVRGPEEPKSRHGFHDLPSRVKTVVAERDQLRAEVAGLRTGYEAYERVNAELKAEVEGLRKFAPSKEIVWCACGDGHAANSYGAGFMDANDGVCANCDAANQGVEPNLDTLRKDAELHRQIQRAAKELPFGWDITLIVEQCAGWVELTDPHGTVVELDDLSADLAVQVSMAIDAALGQGEQS